MYCSMACMKYKQNVFGTYSIAVFSTNLYTYFESTELLNIPLENSEQCGLQIHRQQSRNI